MHKGSCHCGAVRMTLPETPTVATDCNCSLCRRIGGPWVETAGARQIEWRPFAAGACNTGSTLIRKTGKRLPKPT